MPIGIYATDYSAFDSIAYLLRSLYLNNKAFRTKIDTQAMGSKDEALSRFIAVYAANGASTQLCRWRSDLLIKHFSLEESPYKSSTRMMGVTLHLNVMIPHIFGTLASASVTKNCDCHDKPDLIHFVVNEIEKLSHKIAHNLQDAIEAGVGEQVRPKQIKCEKCKKDCLATTELEAVVFVYWHNNEELKLEKLPKNVILMGAKYALKAFVTQKADHYTAHYNGTDGKWRSYNDAKDKLDSSPKKFIPVLVILERQN